MKPIMLSSASFGSGSTRHSKLMLVLTTTFSDRLRLLEKAEWKLGDNAPVKAVLFERRENLSAHTECGTDEESCKEDPSIGPEVPQPGLYNQFGSHEAARTGIQLS